MITVLVVDDSPTSRALLVELLGSSSELRVVGEAKDGGEAVALTRKLQPNVVVMDVNMPGLDGFTATKEIMITAPTPIVIVTATFEGREVDIALRALSAGAVTALGKPPGPGTPGFAEEADHLIRTVKAMSQVKVVRHWRPPARGAGLHPAAQKRPVANRPHAGQRAAVVAVATSTGGPAALQRLLGELPGDFPVPVLVVQHITPGFMTGLASWLDTICEVRVKVAEHGETLAPGTVYLAPEGQHLGVSGRNAVALAAVAPIGGFRPAGTFLFESVARAYGPSALALILTGMGDDGVEGLRTIRQVGGRIIAQDEKSCVVFGMPGVAVAAGLPDEVLPLEAIAARLLELV